MKFTPFNSRERTGILVLILLMMALMAIGLMNHKVEHDLTPEEVQPLYKQMVEEQRRQLAADSAAIRLTKDKRSHNNDNNNNDNKNKRKTETRKQRFTGRKKSGKAPVAQPTKTMPARDRRSDNIPSTP